MKFISSLPFKIVIPILVVSALTFSAIQFRKDAPRLDSTQREPARRNLTAGDQSRTAPVAIKPVPRRKAGDEAPELFERESGEGEGREDWFFFQRAYPAETIPVDAGMRMREQLETEEARLAALQSDNVFLTRETSQQQDVWAAIGPQPIISGRTVGTPRNNVSGRVSAIALDPGYDGVTNRTVYTGGAQGGVWKSVDNGQNWSPLTDNQPSLAIGAIEVDPNSPQTIYVGTGEGSRCSLCYYGAGMLKSTDGGSSWTVIGGPVSAVAPNNPVFINTAFTRIAVDATNSSTIYACTTFGATSTSNSAGQQVDADQVGVWKSNDAGATWRNLDPGGTGGTYSSHDLVIDPLNPNRIYAGMRTIGIYRSEQGGEPGTWTRLGGGLPDPGSNPTGNPSTSPFRRMAMAAGPPVAPSQNTTLYIAFASTTSTLFGIYRSTDNGDSWTRVTTPQTQGQTNYNLDIAVDPADGNTVYYGTQANSSNNGGTLFRSRDGGQTWEDISLGDGITGGLHVDTHQIVISRANPEILFTGNDGGVWRTDNARAALGTLKWFQLNNTISLTQFMSVALHPTDPNILIGGTQDNGTNRFRGNVAWDHIVDGDGGYTLIDQSNPQVMYHTFYNQNNDDGGAVIGPQISFNGGNSWSRRGCFSCAQSQGNFNPSDRVAFYAPMALNTGFTGANGNVVYFGTYRLYRTANRGTTWTGLGQSTDGFGQDLTKGGNAVISAIAGHPDLDNGTNPPGEIVWVGTSDGNVQVTSNAGALASASFANVTKAPLPNRFVTDIALDQGNRQRAVVTYSGFNANTPGTPGHVFLTTNLGASWTDISGNLPDVPVTSVALNPSNSNTIYIGTDLGVFRTTNGGAIWERLGNGMPRVATFMVRYHTASNTLVAATHGRGIYRLSTAGAAATVSAASFSAGSIASESIVAAFGSNLATQTLAATTVPLPTILDGTRVTVRDSIGNERQAPLFFVSPQQVNYLIPAGSAPGAATVTIVSADGSVSTGTIQVEIVAPSIFSANANGREVPAGFALRIKPDGSQINEPVARFDQGLIKFVPQPIDFGPTQDQLFLVLFGTGFRYRSALSNVTVTIGGEPVQVFYAGPQGDFVGLDQLNLLLPGKLAGRGTVEIVITIDGKQANTLQVNFQ